MHLPDHSHAQPFASLKAFFEKKYLAGQNQSLRKVSKTERIRRSNQLDLPPRSSLSTAAESGLVNAYTPLSDGVTKTPDLEFPSTKQHAPYDTRGGEPVTYLATPSNPEKDTTLENLTDKWDFLQSSTTVSPPAEVTQSLSKARELTPILAPGHRYTATAGKPVDHVPQWPPNRLSLSAIEGHQECATLTPTDLGQAALVAVRSLSNSPESPRALKSKVQSRVNSGCSPGLEIRTKHESFTPSERLMRPTAASIGRANHRKVSSPVNLRGATMTGVSSGLS